MCGYRIIQQMIIICNPRSESVSCLITCSLVGYLCIPIPRYDVSHQDVEQTSDASVIWTHAHVQRANNNILLLFSKNELPIHIYIETDDNFILIWKMFIFKFTIEKKIYRIVGYVLYTVRHMYTSH